jgi:hypothetical protein
LIGIDLRRCSAYVLLAVALPKIAKVLENRLGMVSESKKLTWIPEIYEWPYVNDSVDLGT